jgi:hypothetical protein
MIRRQYRIAALTLGLLVSIALAPSSRAATMTCHGGTNDGQTCTTDADCPGACKLNATHPECGVVAPCPRVCRGGDTPGVPCPEGTCPGTCVGGSNPGAACTRYGHDGECTGGGHCNARCSSDRCQVGRCRSGGGHSESSPMSDNLDDDSEVEVAACSAE